MKHMERKYKKEDAMLRPEHTSTLEKNQAKRQAPKSKNQGLDDYEGKNTLDSQRMKNMKRKEMLSAHFNNIAEPDIV